MARFDLTQTTQMVTSAFSQASTDWNVTRGVFSDPQISENGTWSEAWKMGTFEQMLFSKRSVGLVSAAANQPNVLGYTFYAASLSKNLKFVKVPTYLDTYRFLKFDLVYHIPFLDSL